MKRFKYEGEFDGNIEKLPQREHPASAVQFKEPDSMNKLALIGNLLAIAILVILLRFFRNTSTSTAMWGFLLFLLCIMPHELLHAICFRERVSIYSDIRHGVFFVTSTEDLSKIRFVGLSLLPNIVLGLIPFILYMFNPEWELLGIIGAANISAGAGDYINVFNALTQVPRGATIYMSGIHTYWYYPDKN